MAVNLDPTTPADADNPRQGASKIRSLTLQLLSLLTQGGGSAVTFSSPPFSVDTSGNVTIPTTLTVPAPTALQHAATKTYVDQLGPWTGVAAGTNTYAVNLADNNGVAPSSLAQLVGFPLSIQFTNANTGASTLNCNGFGAKAIVSGGNPLDPAALAAGLYTVLIYDGTQFNRVGGSSGTLATKGSFQFTGGLIIKWNVLTFTASTAVSDTFTTAFPNNAFVAVIAMGQESTVIGVSALSTTAITLTSNTSLTGTAYYLAIGN